MSRRVDAGVEAKADSSRPTAEQRVETAQRLGVDERSGAQRRAQVVIGLPDPVHDDSIRGNPGAEGERQLDRPDDLGTDAVRGETSQERRVRIRLDGVRDKRAGQRVGPGSRPRGCDVEVGDVERRPPPLGGLDEKVGPQSGGCDRISSPIPSTKSSTLPQRGQT